MSAIVVALLAGALAAPAAAAERGPGIHARQHFQRHRIEQGVRTGDLTRTEARGLRQEARAIRFEERAFRADGRFTAPERAHVQRDLDRLSHRIDRERHDGDRRFGAPFTGHGFARGWGHPGYYRHYGWRHFRHGGWGPSGVRSEPGIDYLQRQEHRRIVQGIRRGQITPQEARELFAEQRAIRAEERAYRADGVLTPWERRDLYRDLYEASRHIYNERHDEETWR